MERLARQEQVIEHLAANGRSTALAEKRLVALRRSLDTMLQRRQLKAELHDNAPFTTPGQLGPVGQAGQPGAEIP